MGSTLSVNARPNSIPVFCESIHDYRGVQILNYKKKITKGQELQEKKELLFCTEIEKEAETWPKFIDRNLDASILKRSETQRPTTVKKKNKKIMPIFLLVCFAFVLLLFPL